MTAVATRSLSTEHRELVALRLANPTPGIAASLSKRITGMEMEMEMDGIEYEPFVMPTAVKAALADMPDAELRTAFTQAIKDWSADDLTAGQKASLTTKVKRYFEEGSKRSFEDWTMPAFGSGAPRKTLSDEDLISRVHKLRSLIARGDQVKPKIRARAESELRITEDDAKERGLSVSKSPSKDAAKS